MSNPEIKETLFFQNPPYAASEGTRPNEHSSIEGNFSQSIVNKILASAVDRWWLLATTE